MHQGVVGPAQERQIVEVGAPSGLPGSDVVGLYEPLVWAPREAAVLVSPPELPALGLGREAPGATLVHGVAGLVVEGDYQRRITGQAPYDLHGDQAQALELGAERVPVVEQRIEPDVDDHRAGRRGEARRRRTRSAQEGDQRIAQALVVGRISVRAQLLCDALEVTTHLGIGLARQPRRHGATLVVEVHRGPLWVRGALVGPTATRQFGQLTDTQAPGRLCGPVRVTLGVGGVDDRSDLVEAGLSRGQHLLKVGQVEESLAHVGEGGRWRGSARSWLRARSPARSPLRRERPVGVGSRRTPGPRAP